MGKPLKPRLKTEATSVRAPQGTPTCPLDGVGMTYDAEHMRWRCPVDGCKQVAFPPEQVEQGKPILGRGTLEVVRVDDPDGNKAGRTLLRAIDNNVILDITEYISDFTNDPGSSGALVDLSIPFLSDNRTRK